MDDADFLSATQTAAAIRRGDLTSRDVVRRMLDRIDAVNPALNAVVTVDGEAALREAGDLDREAAAASLRGPLHGVAMTVKDSFATAGMRTTSGLTDRAEHVPAEDAEAVARLRRAGAVIVGKTNCPAGVTGQETANVLFGLSRNPWDTERTTGGSSGGAAAAVAAGITPLELGSDKGGSIRQPSAFCGVFGHFPSQGIVPSRGHLPSIEVHELDVHGDLTSMGPMARSAQDLQLALDVLAGPDVIGSRAWRLELPPPRFDDPTQLRVAAWFDDDDFPVDADVVAGLEAAAAALEAAGAEVDRSARPPFPLRDAERVGFDLWVSSGADEEDEDSFAQQQERAALFDDERRLARRARATTLTHRDWLRLDARRRELQRGWEALFEQVHVLLCPVVPVVAFEHDPRPDLVDEMDHRLERSIMVNGQERPYLDQLVWTTAVGLGRLPATVAPVALTSGGLPVGAQIVGPALHDRTTIAVAGLLEFLLGPFRPPRFAPQTQPSGSAP